MQTERTTSTPDGQHHLRGIATTTRYRPQLRKGLFWGAVAVLPAAIGTGIGVLTRSKRAGALAGGIAAGALALTRWQLSRLFIGSPAYDVERRVGQLEVRAYHPSVVVKTVVEDRDPLVAKRTAFDRLDRYLEPARIRMIAPFELSHQGDGYAMTFIMPPGRALATLPRPDDARIRVMELPARRIAALPHRGRYAPETVAERERELLRLVADAGLSTTGRPMFAGFDPPATVSFLRRNEIWIEVV